MVTDPVPHRSTTDAVAMLDDVPLTENEAGYVEAARAANTLRGYRSDWCEFAAWCEHRGDATALPAVPSQISTYLSELAQAGAKVGTLSRRLSAIRFIHQFHDHLDPTRNARVIAVWEGIRRTHGAPPEQANPLMPPDCSTSSMPARPRRSGEPRVGQTSPTWRAPAIGSCY